jgi:uncharacterized protein with HEPN domain
MSIPAEGQTSYSHTGQTSGLPVKLIVIGESLKNLDKITEGKLLQNYPNIDWKKAKGMRDILTHHYTDVNAVAVFNTCKNKIPQLLKTIQKMLEELK